MPEQPVGFASRYRHGRSVRPHHRSLEDRHLDTSKSSQSVVQPHLILAGFEPSIANDLDASPFTDAQRTEVERRLSKHDCDHDSAVSWDDARPRLRQRFG